MPQSPVIGLVMATHMEAKPFLKGLECQKTTGTPFAVYRGPDTVIGISGIGKVNAAMASAFMCMTFSPVCIVNAGAAGAVGHGYQLGDVCQIETAIEADRLHFVTGKPFRHRPDRLSGIATARLATRDRVVLTMADRREMAAIAELVDMEGAAVVQAARRFHTPCHLLKFVSDTPDHTRLRDIPRHIRRYRNAFLEHFMANVRPELWGRYAIASA
ncbi:MAG: hypothetical protein ACQERN_12865 [Thermodesulfobacteriota bacterium]